MPLIHHVVTGHGRPPIVFVHGFGCAHSDWDAQVSHLSTRYQTIAVDLRGHGANPGTPDECSIERYGADVAEVTQTLAQSSAVLVGHSMGCRVVVEAALKATGRVAGVVLVDGSQFAPATEVTLKETFAKPDGFPTLIARWFQEMFNTKSNRVVANSIIERAGHLSRAIGEKVLLDAVRYDTDRLSVSLGSLRVPVMAIQTTYSNERLERRSMSVGQNTPYLEMLRANIPAIRIEIIPGTGHFPQIDEDERVSALMDSFLGGVAANGGC